VQFGQPIGAFQAVKHRLADVLVALRAAEVATDESWTGDTVFATGAAKCLAGRAFRLAAENCLQVMGAIGFTLEHDLHRFIVRGTVLDVLYGSARELRVELGRTLADRGRVPRPGAL
jgi:alkylation response protein AidB-like acyl-CoA dehydrogenase